MSNRIFRKSFAGNFSGINYQSSAIEDVKDNSVGYAANYEWALSNSLRGRVGSQLAGPAGNFFGGAKHSYPKTQTQYIPAYSTSPSINSTAVVPDGSTVAQTVFLNNSLYVLDVISVGVDFVFAGFPVNWWAYYKDSDSHIHFALQSGSTGNVDFDCGDGITTFHTYYEMLVAVAASTAFNVTLTRANCPPIALINGNQTTAPALFTGDNGLNHSLPYNYSHTITVTAGHTFFPGDIIYLGYKRQWEFGYVISTTGTTITFLACSGAASGGGASFTFITGEVLGILGSTAAAFPITTLQTSSTTPFNLSLPYYRAVGTTPGRFNFQLQKVIPSIENGYNPPVFTSLNGILYFASTQSSITRNGIGLYRTPLAKYDGQDIYAAGLPKDSTSFAVAVGAAGTPNGTYRYRYYYRRHDAQGSIIEGTPTNPITKTLVNQKGTITYRNISIDGVQLLSVGALTPGFQANAAYTAEAKIAFVGGAANPIKIDNSNGTAGYLAVGDPICFNDSTTGALVRSTVIQIDGSVSPMTMSIASIGAADIANNTPVSAGISIVFLRTTDSGTIWYQLGEVANDAFNHTLTFSDNIADATLTAGVQFTDPDVGKEHDPPYDCSLVCQHQGGLAIAGGLSQPNTVSFSSADGPEYFPIASNSFDVPSTTVGPITAIQSDTIDRLAVFKADSYYDAAGDLDGGRFSVNVLHEGDYGITSQATLQRVRGALIGLSKLGFVAIQNGVLDDQVFKGINAGIINRPWLFSAACATNDPFTRTYICHIPVDKTLAGGSNTFVLDYSRFKTIPLLRTYASKMNPSYSCQSSDVLYTLSFEANTYANGLVYRRLYRFGTGESPTGNDGDCYIDHVSTIRYLFIDQPENFGEPSIAKIPTRLRIYSISNSGSGVLDLWVPFTVQITFQPYLKLLSYVSSLSFTNVVGSFGDWKLPSALCTAYVLQFDVNSLRQAPFFTGYEVVATIPYAKEDLQK